MTPPPAPSLPNRWARSLTSPLRRPLWMPPSPARRSPFPPRWRCLPSRQKNWKRSSSGMYWANAAPTSPALPPGSTTSSSPPPPSTVWCSTAVRCSPTTAPWASGLLPRAIRLLPLTSRAKPWTRSAAACASPPPPCIWPACGPIWRSRSATPTAMSPLTSPGVWMPPFPGAGPTTSLPTTPTIPSRLSPPIPAAISR